MVRRSIISISSRREQRNWSVALIKEDVRFRSLFYMRVSPAIGRLGMVAVSQLTAISCGADIEPHRQPVASRSRRSRGRASKRVSSDGTPKRRAVFYQTPPSAVLSYSALPSYASSSLSSWELMYSQLSSSIASCRSSGSVALLDKITFVARVSPIPSMVVSVRQS